MIKKEAKKSISKKTTKKVAIKKDQEVDKKEIALDPEENEKGRNEIKKEISRAWYDKLIEELNFLQHTKLQELSDRITEARDFGDLSENAEYQSAIEEKQITDNRIAELKNMISNSIVVDQIIKNNTVQYGSKVTIEIPDGKSHTFEIVWSAELEYEDDVSKITLDSPIGIAIEWKKKWDTCKVRAEKGRYDIKILKVD